jgi:hypothetical protein
LLSEEWAGRISGQLESINSSILSQKKYAVPRSLLVGTVVISCLGLALVIVVAWHSFQLSRATDVSLQRSSETARQAGIAFKNYQELQQQHTSLEAETVRLDSLVQQQSQTIKELKKLNEVAVRAFIQLKKSVDQQAARPAITGELAH